MTTKRPYTRYVIRRAPAEAENNNKMSHSLKTRQNAPKTSQTPKTTNMTLKTPHKRQAAHAGRNGSLKQELANGVENHEIILRSKMARHRLTPKKTMN